jgi:hypothetical protein
MMKYIIFLILLTAFHAYFLYGLWFLLKFKKTDKHDQGFFASCAIVVFYFWIIFLNFI